MSLDVWTRRLRFKNGLWIMLVEAMVVYENVRCSRDVLRIHRKCTSVLEPFGVDTRRSPTIGTKEH